MAVLDEDPSSEIGSSKDADRKMAGVKIDPDVESIGMDREHRLWIVFMLSNAMEGAVPASKASIT